MSKRVSHCLLDPFIGPPIKAIYPRLRIPTWFPPEGIVGLGHVAAAIGAHGFCMRVRTFGEDYSWRWALPETTSRIALMGLTHVRQGSVAMVGSC